jgi:hypothetical protein
MTSSVRKTCCTIRLGVSRWWWHMQETEVVSSVRRLVGPRNEGGGCDMDLLSCFSLDSLICE